MEKRLKIQFFSIILLLLIMPLMAAESTNIQVNTYSGHNIQLDFSKLNPVTNLGTLKGVSDGKGEASFIFTDTSNTFNVNVFIYEGTTKVVSKKFSDLEAGENICITLFSNDQKIETGCTIGEEVVEEVNETESNDTIVEVPEETTEEIDSVPESTSITGLATSNEEGSSVSLKTIFYVIGGIIVLAILFVGILGVRKKFHPTSAKEVKVKKMSEFKKEREEKSAGDYKQAIEEAEKKIEEAQKEIKRLKNADKIEEIKKRMLDDEKELLKLRGEKD